jgi:hypothetical protein
VSDSRTPITRSDGVLKGWRSNAVIDLLSSQRLCPGIGMSITTRGTISRSASMSRSSGDKAKAWAFGATVTGKSLTVQAGRVTIDGTTYKWDVAKYTADISGPTTRAYPHIVLPRDLSSDPAIQVFNAIQDPTSSTIYRELARFVSDDGGTTWRADGDGYILHRGNWHLQAPIVFG